MLSYLSSTVNPDLLDCHWLPAFPPYVFPATHQRVPAASIFRVQPMEKNRASPMEEEDHAVRVVVIFSGESIP